MSDGEVISDHPGPFLVAATHAVPAPGQGDVFDAHVAAIQDTLDGYDAESGLIAYSLRGEIGGRDNWTATVWTDEGAMLAFVGSDTHAAAMAEAGTMLEAGTFVTWEVPDASGLPPRWDDILVRLDEAEPSY
jgi:quinol monooxygenase YgiN